MRHVDGARSTAGAMWMHPTNEIVESVGATGDELEANIVRSATDRRHQIHR